MRKSTDFSNSSKQKYIYYAKTTLIKRCFYDSEEPRPLTSFIVGLAIGYFIALPGSVTTTATTTVTVTSTSPAVTPTATPALEMRTSADTLIITIDTSDAVSLDPVGAYGFTSCFVTDQLYDKLVDSELPDLINAKPEVAERWEYSMGAPVWTFYIGKGISSPAKTLSPRTMSFTLFREL